MTGSNGLCVPTPATYVNPVLRQMMRVTIEIPLHSATVGMYMTRQVATPLSPRVLNPGKHEIMREIGVHRVLNNESLMARHHVRKAPE
jgi:hypothetical protein